MSSDQRGGSGDVREPDDLLQQNLPALRAFIRLQCGPQLRQRESCDDLVQSVCREWLEARRRNDLTDGPVGRGWLFAAARNKIRQRVRYFGEQKRDPVREVCLDPGLIAAYSTLGPSRQAMRQEDIQRLEAAFDRLSDPHREVIALAKLAELPLAEVGQRMEGRSVAAVSMLLGRALAALDALLHE